MEECMQKNIPESQAIIQLKSTLPKKMGITKIKNKHIFVKPIPNETIRNSCIF